MGDLSRKFKCKVCLSRCMLCKGAPNGQYQCGHHLTSYRPLSLKRTLIPFRLRLFRLLRLWRPFESIPHFLFHCPTYSSLRTSLVEVATSFGTIWPPDSLQRLCQCDHLWNSVLKFVLRTKRLALAKACYSLNLNC